MRRGPTSGRAACSAIRNPIGSDGSSAGRTSKPGSAPRSAVESASRPGPFGDDPSQLADLQLGPLVAQQRERDPLATDVGRRDVDPIQPLVVERRARRPCGPERAALRRGPVHGRDRDGRHPARADRAAAAARRAPRAPGPRARRIVAERAGMAPTRPPSAAPSPGFDVASGRPPAEPIGFGSREAPARTWAAERDDRPSPVPTTAFELPAELAIDTDVARRVIAEFIRGQLEQAGFERAVLGLSGGIDSALVAYLVAEAIGAGPAARGADAVPDLVAGVAGRRRVGRRAPRLRERAGRHQRRWSTATSGRTTPARAGRTASTPAAAARQLRGPDADGRAVRPLGDVGRPRRRDGQQDRVAHRLHDAVRRLGLRVQPDRRPVQEPGPPAGGRARRARRDRPQGAVGRPVARPDRRDRGRVQLPGPRPAAVLAGRQAPVDRGDGRARVRPGDGRAGRPDDRRRRVQAPGAADRQARAADGGRRLPVPAAPAGLAPR